MSARAASGQARCARTRQIRWQPIGTALTARALDPSISIRIMGDALPRPMHDHGQIFEAILTFVEIVLTTES
jgi:hypothetical protein